MLTIASGIILVLAVAYLITSAFGLRIAGSEILSRTAPSLLDLGVAIAAGAAAGHFALGIIAFLVARTRFSKPLFEHTLREIEKDRQWLQDHKKP